MQEICVRPWGSNELSPILTCGAAEFLGDIGYIDIIQTNCGYAEGMPPWLSRLGGWSQKGANQVNATGHGR